MKKLTLLVLLVLCVGWIQSCETNDLDQTTEIEASILKVIAADDSTYGIDGMDDIEDTEYALSKLGDMVEIVSSATYATASMDSNSIWRFGRRQMQSQREITVEVETDSSAIALITHHITGNFHVKEFARVWVDADNWERGDSLRFSVKPIDMVVNRHVVFRKRLNAAGDERWIATSMTLAYGASGEALNIESLTWIAGDSVKVVTDFSSIFYPKRHPLGFELTRANHVNVNVSNEVAEAGEVVIGRFGYHPRLAEQGLRNRIKLQYIETLDTGDKVYGRGIPTVNRPNRHFKGFVEALDQRTLFDHDYDMYTSATLGFVYTLRRPALTP